MKTFVIFSIAAFYAYVGNHYFGNHWKPQSGEEVIFDGIFLLIVVLGVIASSPGD